MKNFIFKVFGWSLLIAILLLFSYCAQPGTPSGGPPDKEGPLIQDTIPLPRSLNFQGDEVVLKFNEYIKIPTYGKEIFISPFMAVQPEVKVVGKKLKIRFKEPLRPSTTYVLSFIDIKDYYGGNKMAAPFTLAFSTGAVIDSMKVAGKVVNRSNKGMEDYTILLFEADSIQDHDFLGKRPAYLTKTDKNGNFELSYLRNIQYNIYGIADKDQSNTYSLATEPLALAPSALISFSDSSNTIPPLELKAFAPDEKAPALRSYKWLSDSVLLCEFTRGLRADSLQIHLTDTLGGDSVSITNFSYLNQQLLLAMPRKQEARGTLHLQGMVDSLGHIADSALQLQVKRPQKPDLFPLFTKIEIDPDEQGYVFYLPQSLSEERLQKITLRDTGKLAFPIRIIQDNFKLWVKPEKAMSPEIFYYIWLDGSLYGEQDTTYRYKVSPWEPDKYGSLSGKVIISNYQGPFVVFFDGPRKLSVTDTVFSFSHLPAGDYKISALLDKDGSQSWTPGSLSPYSLPERIIPLNSPVTIRANWTVEDQMIEFDAAARSAADTTGGEAGSGSRGENPGVKPKRD